MLPGFITTLHGGLSPTSFAVSAPANATTNVAFNFTVTAMAGSIVVPGYTGTVRFTSTAGGASLPGNVTLTNGSGTFTASFPNAGAYTITAIDTNNALLTGTSGAISTAWQTSNGSAAWSGNTSWTVPTNFNPNNNYAEAWGAGGCAALNSAAYGGGGGGAGGAYARKYNIQAFAGQVLPIVVGPANGAWHAAGSHSGILNPSSTAWLCLAYGGGGGNPIDPADPTYGAASYGGVCSNGYAGVGELLYPGGSGGHMLNSICGGGGGGCAGPSGGGGTGGTHNGGTMSNYQQAPGGGGGGAYAGAGGAGGYYSGVGGPGGAYGGGGGGPLYTGGGAHHGEVGLVFITWFA